MKLFVNGVKLLVLTCVTTAFFVNLKKLDDLEKKYNLEFLKDYLKFPVYINPHPRCALKDEECTIDANCCGGRECKMAVDREGVKYTCQGRVVEGDNESATDTEEVDDWESGESDDNSLLGEIYRTRLEELNREEQKLVNDQYYMIKELQKPLTFDEMRELQQVKEVQDYKRENELKELRDWAESRKAEEERNRDTENKLQNIAVERVSKVLKEEEQQKRAMLKEIQEQMKRKRSWF